MKAPKHLELKKKYFEKEELKKSAVAQPFGKALQNKMAKTKGNDTMIPLLRTINALSITLNGHYIF